MKTDLVVTSATTGRKVQSEHQSVDAVRVADARQRVPPLSLLERNGQPLRVVIPYERGRKVAVLTPRSKTELKPLKAQGGAVKPGKCILLWCGIGAECVIAI